MPVVAALQYEIVQPPFDEALRSPPTRVPIDDPRVAQASRHMATYWTAGEPLPIGPRPDGRLSLYTTGVALDGPSTTEPGQYATRHLLPIDDGCVRRVLADGASALAQDPAVTEPFKFDAGGNDSAAGVVLVDESGGVTVIEPAGHFGGYRHTFPKGHVDPRDADMRAAALRHLNEKTGLTGDIVAFVGDFPGDETLTRYYLAVSTGGDGSPAATTATVERVSPTVALDVLNRQRDQQVMRAVLELAGGAGSWTWTIDGLDHHCRLMRTAPCHLQMVPDEQQMQDAQIAALAGTGVWAAQFGPGQHRFWFTPGVEMERDALFDRVAGIITRELGKEVMLSALWLYPDDALNRDRPDGLVTFMLHLVARDPRRTRLDAEYKRISTSIINELADRSAEHWPPASDGAQP